MTQLPVFSWKHLGAVLNIAFVLQVMAGSGVVRAAERTARCTEIRGQIHEDAIPSGAKNATVPVLVYVPPCYETTPTRRYPVVYLLHGAGADETQWDDVNIDEMADQLITDGAIAPLILVFPGGGQSGSVEYNRFVVEKLVPHIDQTFRTEADRTHRAIGGISMGGRSALTIAAQHPELFSAVGGHSPAIGSAIDLTSLVTQPARIWLDVGTDDSLLASVEQFAQMLSKQKLSYTLRTWPGQHNRPYWRAHTADYLRFYAATWSNSQQLPLYCGTLTGAALGAARLTQTPVGRT